MRINKYLAECGVGSRRSCDKLIEEGRVRINQKPITELGVDVNIENDTVTVDGHKVKLISKKYYIMLHKPKGFITTVNEDKQKAAEGQSVIEGQKRKTVMELIDINVRLYPIGRLDYDSEGLLLMTNDGELTHRLTHPSFEVPKTYIVKFNGAISETEMQQLRKGVVVDEKITAPAKVKLLEFADDESRLEITIREGRNHQIKKMLEVVGKQVTFLKRTEIGDIRLGGLTRGTYRHLNEKELKTLQKLTRKKSEET